MTKGPEMVTHHNLSIAWGSALLKLLDRGTDKIVPLAVTITDLEHGITEDREIREATDRTLAECGMRSIRTTANTIFPRSMWNSDAAPQALYERYIAAYQRIQKSDRENQYGTYFYRMIAHMPVHPKVEAQRHGRAEEALAEPVNQLRHIFNTYAVGNHRSSALQAVVFDPTRDHTNQRRRGFPCLHQVAFSPLGGGKLAVCGFYGTQHIFQRGYGNYVGLCELGEFMARGLGMELSRVTCVAAVAEIGATKERMQQLAGVIREVLARLPNEENREVLEHA